MSPLNKPMIWAQTVFTVVFMVVIDSKQIQGAPGKLRYTLPAGTSSRDKYLRDLACYVFDGISGAYDQACRTELSGTLDTSQIPPNAAEGLDSLFDGAQSDFDVANIRAWWNQWSSPLRSLRGQQALVPTRLEDFEHLHQFKNWPREVILKSRVKSRTRVIYRSPVGHHNMSVSETRDSVTGNLESKVVETEVVIERFDHSGNFDFFAYDAQGQLSTTAWFPSGEKILPGICLSCHHSPTSGTFKRSGR